MSYRLIELTQLARKDNPNISAPELWALGLPEVPDINDPKYEEVKGSFFNGFYSKSAEARRGVTSDYTRETTLPRLPIDCFVDEKRLTIGDTDMSEPEDPTPDEPPKDPVEVANDAIEYCKEEIMYYDGKCKKGDEGVPPGRWYQQPIYCEIVCESDAIKRQLEKFQNADGTERYVRVTPIGGSPSVPVQAVMAKRFRETVQEYDWIEEIVVLYFGDSDDKGNEIRQNIVNAMAWYSGQRDDLPEPDDFVQVPVPVEVRHVAITPEQVETMGLTGYQLEALTTTEQRISDFQDMIIDAIDECWDEQIFLNNTPDEEYDYAANDEA